MRKINLVLLGVAVFVAVLVGLGFSSGQLSQNKLDTILADVPEEWWEGGWDKISQLQDLIAQNPNNLSLCAEAQYWIASQYYASRDHERALQEYQNLINTYASSWLQCQMAQYEMGQIYLYRLNKPEQAIIEYDKALKTYPRSYVTPMSQLGIARAYRKLGNLQVAHREYEVLLNDYPEFKKDITQANLDLGVLSLEEAFAEGADKVAKTQKLAEAVSSFKRAFLACNLENTELLKQSIDGIYRALRALDSDSIRANQFVKFQKYGPEGEDGIPGTQDDLQDPLKGF